MNISEQTFPSTNGDEMKEREMSVMRSIEDMVFKDIRKNRISFTTKRMNTLPLSQESILYHIISSMQSFITVYIKERTLFGFNYCMWEYPLNINFTISTSTDVYEHRAMNKYEIFEKIISEDISMFTFIRDLCELLCSEKDTVGEDLLGMTKEWLLMQMNVRYGYSEDDVRSNILILVETAVRHRIGTIDIRKGICAENCYLSLLSVF